MSPEFLQKLAALFDGESPDKYNAYLNLREHEGQIHTEWKRRLAIKMRAYFNDPHLQENAGWKLKIWDNDPFESTWYLTEFGEKSLSIYMKWEWMRFWIDGSYHNARDLKELISGTKYGRLLSEGLEIDFPSGYNVFGGREGEQGQWVFGSALDNKFTHINQLLWYAGNRTEDYLHQIAAKVNRIRKNPQLVELMRDFNLEVMGDQPLP